MVPLNVPSFAVKLFRVTLPEVSTINLPLITVLPTKSIFSAFISTVVAV
jgi:hypothetical protein